MSDIHDEIRAAMVGLDADDYRDAMDYGWCEHINECEIAGGWMECADCGRITSA